MPIYSESDEAIEDRLASGLAAAGATTSLAATAAAALRADPAQSLSPRLANALRATLKTFERASSLDDARLEEVLGSTDRQPEMVLARLAQPAPEQEAAASATKEMIERMVEDLRTLLSHPTPDVAARAEQFLGVLARVENAEAQSLARGSLELEYRDHLTNV